MSADLESETRTAVGSVGALEAHQALVNRIVRRAQQEGCPLASLELQQFDSDRMAKDEFGKFNDEFEREYTWQGFLDRISGLLRRAIEEDAANDPDAPRRYDNMVHELEGAPESFSLWACCVPAIPHYKSAPGSGSWAHIIVTGAILAVVIVIVLRALKVL